MKKLVKVCGMRDEENISHLQKLEIDYMGMIFYSKSPRYVESVLKFDKSRKLVGVFVDATNEYIEEKISEYALDVLQLHGNESVEQCRYFKSLGLEVFKAFGVDDDFNFDVVDDYKDVVDLFVFDKKTSKYGGSGEKYSWSKLNSYSGETPFLLSGGISGDDIDEILLFNHPKCIGVDLNSGFEISPAMKDIDKLKIFIKKYRA